MLKPEGEPQRTKQPDLKFDLSEEFYRWHESVEQEMKRNLEIAPLGVNYLYITTVMLAGINYLSTVNPRTPTLREVLLLYREEKRPDIDGVFGVDFKAKQAAKIWTQSHPSSPDTQAVLEQGVDASLIAHTSLAMEILTEDAKKRGIEITKPIFSVEEVS